MKWTPILYPMLLFTSMDTKYAPMSSLSPRVPNSLVGITSYLSWLPFPNCPDDSTDLSAATLLLPRIPSSVNSQVAVGSPVLLGITLCRQGPSVQLPGGPMLCFGPSVYSGCPFIWDSWWNSLVEFLSHSFISNKVKCLGKRILNSFSTPFLLRGIGGGPPLFQHPM